jgi:hypothetical protein
MSLNDTLRRNKMGRPIKKKFFGNLNAPGYGSNNNGSGVGGEGVATIVKNNTGTLYTTSTTLNLTFTAPQIKGGARPTGRVTTNVACNVATVTLLTAGSGYTSVPTATVNGGTTGTTATFTIALLASTSTQNAIAFTSFLTTGSNAVTGGDIIKQESSRRYLVQNSEGIGQCKLVAADVLAEGEMKIIATDFGGATYFVTKLTARKANLVNRTGTSTALVSIPAGGTGVGGWTLGSSTGTIVTVASV